MKPVHLISDSRIDSRESAKWHICTHFTRETNSPSFASISCRKVSLPLSRAVRSSGCRPDSHGCATGSWVQLIRARFGVNPPTVSALGDVRQQQAPPSRTIADNVIQAAASAPGHRQLTTRGVKKTLKFIALLPRKKPYDGGTRPPSYASPPRRFRHTNRAATEPLSWASVRLRGCRQRSS